MPWIDSLRRAAGFALDCHQALGEVYTEVLEARAKMLEVRGHLLDALEEAWRQNILLEGFLLTGGLVSLNLHLLKDPATTLR